MDGIGRIVLTACVTLVAAASSPNPAIAQIPAIDTHCPFTFATGMAPGVFCVYAGVALGLRGEVCADPVFVLWTRSPPMRAPARDDRDVPLDGVYFGFSSDSNVVMRAAPPAGADGRVRIADYTRRPHAHPVPLQGVAERRSFGASPSVDTLTLRVRPPLEAGGRCEFTSFDGIFIGVLTLPGDT